MTKILIALTALVIATPAMAQYGYQQQPQLQYNPFNQQWHYEQPGSTLQYNPMNQQWGYAQPGSQPQFNPFTGQWERR
jgi:hypothetical protein